MRSATGALLVMACLGLTTSCGDAPASQGVLRKPNSPWDPDGDGVSNGTYIDVDDDGISDGIDTDDDGEIDLDAYGRELKPGTGDGDGDRGGDGDTSSVGDGDDDGDGKCEEHIVKNDRIPPDMLIVLDRSGSMKQGNTNRWDPSVMALKSVTMQLGGGISFGLMSFPQAGGDSCAVGKVDVPIAPGSAPAINAALTMMKPGGNTPTSITLAAAHKLLGPVSADPDAIVVPKYVLLVTDGAPNCLDDKRCKALEPTANPILEFQKWLMELETYTDCMNLGDTQAIDDSEAEIKAMAADGIKTYVVGYDTDKGSLKTTMDRLAAAGGTGEKTHIAVKNGDELTKALETIAGKAASCTIQLDEAVSDPSYVLVTIDDALMLGLNQKDGNGFSVDKDNRTITILGSSCDTLRSSTDHKVHVEVLCEPVIF